MRSGSDNFIPEANEDSLLLRSFEDHPAYLQILNHEKFCILGRKGSGKTAIFKKILKDRKADTFSFGHTFSDYPWHHHDKQNGGTSVICALRESIDPTHRPARCCNPTRSG